MRALHSATAGESPGLGTQDSAAAFFLFLLNGMYGVDPFAAIAASWRRARA